jgi:hypothetical protein
MNPAEKALWFVESHFASDISLDEVAAIGGVSRYHMTRAFAAAHRTFSPSPSRQAMVRTKAFTRAFRDQFGVTPEHLRQGRNLGNMQLVEPIAMADTPPPTLKPPCIETRETLLIAESSERYTHATGAGLRALRREVQSRYRPWRLRDLDPGTPVIDDRAGRLPCNLRNDGADAGKTVIGDEVAHQRPAKCL